MSTTTLRSARAGETATAVRERLGIETTNAGAWTHDPLATSGSIVASVDPSTGEPIANVRLATRDQYEQVARAAREAFLEWREWPAPRRGEVVRQHISHLVHHRGQLTVYLRLVDVPLPSVYGPTADERW